MSTRSLEEGHHQIGNNSKSSRTFPRENATDPEDRNAERKIVRMTTDFITAIYLVYRAKAQINLA